MKNFNRKCTLVSLCGLNCGLCPMNLGGYCPGCGGGEGNQSCEIARCSMLHGEIEFCYLCYEYPCEKYEKIHELDSFITHRNQLKDLEKIKNMGLEFYTHEIEEKIEILKYLLENCNDGRRKNFFCIAINLLELQDIKYVLEQIVSETESQMLSQKEKAAIAVNLFQKMAMKRNIVLKLNKKACEDK